MRLLITCILGLLLLFSQASLAKTPQAWSPEVFAYVKENFGEDAEKRMRYLNKLILKNRDKPVMEKLRLANTTLNQFPWIADQRQWKKSDFWATPLQMIASFGGDCEDIAIAKFAMLRHLGIPRDQLYLAYVRIKNTHQSHMVLLYKDRPKIAFNQAKIYVLDNNDPKVKIASQRTDLTGVYILDPDGGVYLINDQGDRRSVGQRLNIKKLKNFKMLQQKYLEEQQLFKKLNHGKYLFDYD